jgi:tellurite resistance protein
MFGLLKKVAGAGAREVKAEYGANKDFLEAVCAAAALVAASDGSIGDSEKRKAVSLIQNHAQLSKLYQSNVIEQTADTMFKRASDSSGKQQLARELDDIKTRPDGAQMAEDVYLIAQDVANADGSIDEAEQTTLNKIASRMGVDVSKFDF